MSDFDAEAEREKLREKYERDREKREATQRMSELLLKGATMTNRHCDRCGDPIFRYQGQEFCPTCQREQAAQEEGRAQAQEQGAQAQEQGAQAQEQGAQAQAEDGQRAQGDADAGADASESEAATPSADEVEIPDAGPSTPTAPAASEATGADAGVARASSQTDGQDGSDAATPPARERPARPARGDDVAEARASLRRTLAEHAAAAEEATDPRRARDHLAVVRDAAEALAALDR